MNLGLDPDGTIEAAAVIGRGKRQHRPDSTGRLMFLEVKTVLASIAFKKVPFPPVTGCDCG